MLAIRSGNLRGVWTAIAVVAAILLPIACTATPSAPAASAPSAPAPPASTAPSSSVSAAPSPPATSEPAPLASSAPSSAPPPETGCTITGPQNLVPKKVASVRVGMTVAEVQRVLGKPQYSPVEGQYYFFTGAKCPLDGRTAPCGVVAEFHTDAPRKGTLESCWWGAIGE